MPRTRFPARQNTLPVLRRPLPKRLSLWALLVPILFLIHRLTTNLIWTTKLWHYLTVHNNALALVIQTINSLFNPHRRLLITTMLPPGTLVYLVSFGTFPHHRWEFNKLLFGCYGCTFIGVYSYFLLYRFNQGCAYHWYLYLTDVNEFYGFMQDSHNRYAWLNRIIVYFKLLVSTQIKISFNVTFNFISGIWFSAFYSFTLLFYFG